MKRIACVVVLLAMGFAGRVGAAETACGYRIVPTQYPFALERDRIRNLLLDGRFEELDALEVKSRDLSQRTPDGAQLRSAFFAGIGSSMTGRRECLGHKPDEARPVLQAMNARVAEKLAEWRRERPESRAVPIAEAMLHIDTAWVARGISYASLVPESAWPIFKSNMQQAVEMLDGLDDSFKSDPAWVAARLGLAAQVDSDMDEAALLAESLASARQYYDVYSIAANFLQPQWGGSDAQASEFLESILTARDGPPDRYVTYTRTAWDLFSLDMFRRGRVRWEPMKRGFEEIVAAHPHPWNVNVYAKYSCVAGDWDTLRELLARIDGHPVDQAWGPPTYAECVRAAKPRVSPAMAAAGGVALLLLVSAWIVVRRRQKA